MATKTCTKCRKEKPIENFGMDPSNPNGRRIWCKECISRYIDEKNRDPKGSRAKQWLSGARIRSRKRGWSFDLDRECLLKLACETTHCPYCGKKLDYHYTEVGWTDDTPTLDRIRPDLGYIKQNIAICCWGCNDLKSDTPGERLFVLGRHILKLEKERKL